MKSSSGSISRRRWSLPAVAVLGLAVGVGGAFLRSWRAEHADKKGFVDHAPPTAAQTENPTGTGSSLSASHGGTARGATSQEAMLALARKDPERFLRELPALTVALNEEGKGTQEQVTSWLKPALQAALEGLWDIAPERAFEALKGLRDCGELVWTAGAAHLVDSLSLRGNPADVAELVMKHTGINYGYHFAGVWASKDPESALAWAVRQPMIASPAVRRAIGVWAESDPVSAQRYVVAMKNERLRNSAMDALIKKLPKTGAALTPVVETILDQWESPGAMGALGDALTAWEKNDPATLSEWMEKQENAPYGEALLTSRAEAAFSMLASNPAHATAALRELISPAGREEAIYNGVLRVSESVNPVATWGQLSKLEDPELRAQSYGALMRQMTNLVPQEMLNAVAAAATREPDVMLAALQDTNTREPGLLRAAWTDDAVRSSLAKTNPEAAAKIIGILNTPSVPPPSR